VNLKLHVFVFVCVFVLRKYGSHAGSFACVCKYSLRKDESNLISEIAGSQVPYPYTRTSIIVVVLRCLCLCFRVCASTCVCVHVFATASVCVCVCVSTHTMSHVFTRVCVLWVTLMCDCARMSTCV